MNKQNIIAGYLLVLAAVTFWISWLLMPDPGTVDANHILTIVKQSRTAVLSSVIVQIISSVVYLLALFLMVKTITPKNWTMAGIVLLGIGAMGLCADAFFHVLAWCMTNDTVSKTEDVVRVMHLMQTDGVIILLPVLLPLFIGSIVMAIGLYRQKKINRVPGLLFLIAILVGIANAMMDNKMPDAMLVALGVFAAGQALIGVQIARSK